MPAREVPVNNNIKTIYEKLQDKLNMELSVPLRDLGSKSLPEQGRCIGFKVVLRNSTMEGCGMYQMLMDGKGSEAGHRNTVFNRFEIN